AVPGTSIGTATDLDGKYALSVPEGSTLVFSFIGFESQEVEVGERSVINITLIEDLTSLDEVVVVGYGTQSRALVTTSVSTLDTKVLDNAAMSNVGAALQGTVPGLRVINNTGQPGTTPSILLRGGASITSTGSPLVVVDGVIRAMNDINPND